MSQTEAIYALWLREFKVFTREKSRIVSSIFTPMLWIFVFGGGLGSAVNIGNVNYQVFIYPGILAMSVLFSSVFFGVYIIWDRKIDILKEILVAPLSRTTIFVGKVLGGCTDSMIQALIMALLKSAMTQKTMIVMDTLIAMIQIAIAVLIAKLAQITMVMVITHKADAELL